MITRYRVTKKTTTCYLESVLFVVWVAEPLNDQIVINFKKHHDNNAVANEKSPIRHDDVMGLFELVVNQGALE